MALVFYYHPLSQPSRAVWNLLVEDKKDFELKFIDLAKGEHKKPEFLAVHPQGAIPALSHGDFHLSESVAIADYVSRKNGTHDKWFGQDDKERARVTEYVNWHHTHTRKGAGVIFFTFFAKLALGEGDYSAQADAARKDAKATLDFLEKHVLAHREYIAGKTLTFADLLAFHELYALQTSKLVDFNDYHKVNDWLAKIAGLESTKQTLGPWNGFLQQVSGGK